jgi:hypothetical protein
MPMPQRPKPPIDKSSRSGNRHEAVTMPADSPGFSIETTTMRLKSLKLRRADVADQQISDAIKPTKTHDSKDMQSGGPSGRVRHDERGVAVWDWAVASGEFCTLSTSLALKKLEVADLKIEDHKPIELKPEVSGRDKAGGFDPYNQRGSGKRQGEAAQRAGVTGSPTRERGSVLDQLTGKKK